jgi:hypothetical protein
VTRDGGPWSDPAVDAGFAAAYEPLVPEPVAADLLVEDAEPVGTPGPGAGSRFPLDPFARRDTPPQATQEDERDAEADLAGRPLTRAGRRARAASPSQLSPARALTGAAVSVSGVLLGIGTLLWVSDDPGLGPGPVVVQPPSAAVDGGTDLDAGTSPAPTPAGELASPAPVESASAAPAAAATAPPPSAAAAARSVVVPVTVLNNSRRTGLAERAAARFRAGGWPVVDTGNFRGRIPSTTVYYEPGQQASARAFAARFDGIVRVRPRFATLPARGLVVVLTREFPA